VTASSFSPRRTVAALALLAAGFALLAFALLMDARLTPPPYPDTTPPAGAHGN